MLEIDLLRLSLTQRTNLVMTPVVCCIIAGMARNAKEVVGCGNGGACAEVEAILKALNAGVGIKGARIGVAWIGGRARPNTVPGASIAPCGSCAHWTDALGLKW